MAAADPLRNLGVRLSSRGGEIRVWSASATSIDLCLFDGKDPNWVTKTIPLSKDSHDVWSATTRSLSPGTYQRLRADHAPA
jgi:glycogen operon protein